MLEAIIETVKENVTSHYNYQKGVSLVPESVIAIYNQIVADNDGDEAEALEELEELLRVDVASTGSIYIRADLYGARIADHSKDRDAREYRKMFTGKVTGGLQLTFDF